MSSSVMTCKTCSMSWSMTMADKYVLCRWTVHEIGEPKKYCGKPIAPGAKRPFCAVHLARLPFWPTEKSGLDKADGV